MLATLSRVLRQPVSDTIAVDVPGCKLRGTQRDHGDSFCPGHGKEYAERLGDPGFLRDIERATGREVATAARRAAVA